jgi:ribosome biogenesis GTPase
MERKTGLVLRSTGGLNIVKLENGEKLECQVRGKIRLKGIRSTNPIVVGDKVVVQIEDNSGQAVIIDILERKNYIIRRSTNLSKESHILAANIDQVYIVATIIEPTTSMMFIDRLLVTAEAYSIPAKIVFNKIDICHESALEKLSEYAVVYESIGYPCLFVSATKNIGLEALREDMAGKVSMFTGHSGVGKSSLINRIEPAFDVKTGNISELHRKGKHTTTFASMFELNNGGYIVDTPGIKAFGLLDIDRNELYHYFPEIFKAAENCKFHNCTHIHEPGCKVFEEVENGNIPASRYQNYVNIFLDRDDERYRIDDYA